MRLLEQKYIERYNLRKFPVDIKKRIEILKKYTKLNEPEIIAMCVSKTLPGEITQDTIKVVMDYINETKIKHEAEIKEKIQIRDTYMKPKPIQPLLLKPKSKTYEKLPLLESLSN